MSVFVDSSAIYAALDGHDKDHESAIQQWRQLRAAEEMLSTTNYVLLETSALLQNRLGLDAVRDLYERYVPVLEIEWIGEAEHNAAMNSLLNANRRSLSLVDHVSFSTMRRKGIRKAFTFDHHFDEQQFERLPAVR